MSMIGRLYILIFLVASSTGKLATNDSGDDQLSGSANDHLIGTSNAQDIKELRANVSSLWVEINGLIKWTQQHEKRVHHNYDSYGYRGNDFRHHGNDFGHHDQDFGHHAPDGHSAYYGGHYSHWHPGMFPPRVWYHYHDIAPDRSHHLQFHTKNNLEYFRQRKKTDDSSEEEEEEEEEENEKKKKEKNEGKKKNKEKKEEEMEENEKVEEEKKGEGEEEEEEVKISDVGIKEEEVKNGEVENEEVVKNGKVEENEENEEVTNGVVKVAKNVKEEEVEEGEEKEEKIMVRDVREENMVEEHKTEEEVEEEEENVKPRARSLIGGRNKAQHGRKGHKKTLLHNLKGHLKTKKHSITHAKKLDENEIISKAFCDFSPNVEMPDSNFTGNVTIFQKRNSKGPLYFLVNLQGLRISEEGASRTHGFHIHANPLSDVGHCNSTGPHFNPTGKNHGSLHSDIRHLGDFGNIVVDKNGRLEQFIFVNSTNTLEGVNSIISKSIDVHENPDDLGKGGDEESLRSGNAGLKLACCTIHTLADALTKLNG